MSILVMSHVWKNSKQEGASLLVLLALADFAHDDGLAWPSVLTLAKKARISERHCQRILKQLIDDGEIEVKYNAGPGGVNLIRVLLRTPQKPPEDVVVGGDIPVTGDILSPPSSTTPPGDTPVTTGVSPMSPRTVIEPSIEPPTYLPPISSDGDQAISVQEPKPKQKRQRKADPTWDVIVDLFGEPSNDGERGKWNRAVALLKQSEATPDEIRKRFKRYPKVMKGATCTPNAIATNWTLLADGRSQARAPTKPLMWSEDRDLEGD